MIDRSPSWPYVLDHEMLMAVSRIERGLGAISRAPLLPQLRHSLRKEARRRSSRATAAIEGVDVDVAGVDSLERGMAPLSRNEREVSALVKTLPHKCGSIRVPIRPLGAMVRAELPTR